MKWLGGMVGGWAGGLDDEVPVKRREPQHNVTGAGPSFPKTSPSPESTLIKFYSSKRDEASR